jgi:molybdenum cofactor cytidylyltransferase
MPNAPSAVGAIILAAGRSTRLGRNKLVADLAGKPVVAHVVDAVAAAGLPPPLVVLGHEADAVRAALEGRSASFVIAADFEDGMARSIAAGISAAPREWTAAIICLGDMPLVGADVLRSLATRAASDAVVVPTCRGRRGNPVLWGRDHFAELRMLQGDAGARALFPGLVDRLVEVDCADPGIHIDVDTEAGMATALSALGH